MAKRGVDTELTERDIIIIQGLADGKNDNEIAQDLNLSLSTVNAAFPKIMIKLGAKNRYNALYLAVKRNIIK